MTVIEAAILGFVQGVGEFLPISSSGHLVLLQRLFGVSEGSMSFGIAVHIGTLVALVAVMRKRLLSYLNQPLGRVPVLVVIGTVPTAIMALALKRFLESLFDTGASLGVGFLLTAAMLVFAETWSKRMGGRTGGRMGERAGSRVGERMGGRMDGGMGGHMDGRATVARAHVAGRRIDEANIADALAIGFAQGVATVPAISRSGSTIAAGLICGLGRESAVEYAFLLSIPIMLLAVADDALSILLGRGGAGVGALPTAVGVLVAMAVGFPTARIMLRKIRKINLKWFAVYTAALGVLVLVDQLFIGAFFAKIV